jgi:hypothetical protein
MKIDFKRFKKVHSNEHATTLEHKDGHHIRIAHNALSKENKEELDAVPMMAEGGDVPQLGAYEDASNFNFDNPNGPELRAPASEAPHDYSDVPGVGAWAAQGMQNVYTPGEGADARFSPKSLDDTSMIGGFASKEANAEQSSIAKKGAEKVDISSPKIETELFTQKSGALPAQDSSGYAHGIADVKAGLRAGAKAQELQAGMELQAANDNIVKQQEMQQNYQNSYNELEQSRKDLMLDIKNGHIDPNHYMSSMSDGGRIATAIGMLMGGIGGGANGTSNPAMDFLNKQIDRDIESQKSTLNSKHTLLSATMQQFGNLKDATQMARVYQTDIYKGKLEQAMATAKSPMAKAALQKAIGELDMITAPILQEMSQKKAIMAGLQSGAASPAQAVSILVPKEQRAEAYKELSNLENSHKAVKDIDTYAKKMNELQTVKGRASWGAGSEIDSMNTQVMGAMHSILGTLSDSDKKLAEANTIFLSDPPNVRASKISQLKQLALKAGTATPVLDSVGMNLRKPSDAPAHSAIKGAPRRH